MLARSLLFGLPLAFSMLTWWSAEKVSESHRLRQGDLVALLSDTEMPQLHPFLPATEADRQLVDLIHAPLIKIGANGGIAPALANEWRWLKRVSVWFGTPGEALEAKARLVEASTERWAAWKLESVEVSGTSMCLTFNDPILGAMRDTLQMARARVLSVVILRVNVPQFARAARAVMLGNKDLESAVQRSWVDGEDAFEVAVAGMKEGYPQEIERYLQTAFPNESKINVAVQNQQFTLEEPVLEFGLRDNAVWHDGTRVTANDVQATFNSLMATNWQVPEREGLRVVRAVEVMAPNRVHAVLWRHRGPALCAWIGLPILQSAWLKAHPFDQGGHVFRDSVPVGAGPCMVEHRNFRSLVIRPAASAGTSMRRLSLVTNLSGFTTQLGYTTNALDLFWPGAPSIPQTLPGESLAVRESPPQVAVRAVLNTRSELLSDSKVRTALQLATDREELVRTSLRGRARPLLSLFAPGLWLASEKTLLQPHADPAAAQRVLSEDGWLRGISGLQTKPLGTLMLNLAVPAGNDVLASVGADLRLQWMKLGIQVNLRILPESAIELLKRDRTFDVIIEETPLQRSWDLWPQWHSESSANVSGFRNRQADLLVEALASEFDPAEAAKRAQKAESIILAEHPVLPLLTLNDRTVLRASLPGAGNAAQPWTLRDLLSAPKPPAR